MTKSLSQRLCRAEEAAEDLKLWQRKCASCGSPIPAIVAALVLGPAGYYRGGQPCLDCFEEGGGGQVGVDPQTGEPDGPCKLILLGLGFPEWLDLHGEKRFGGAVDLTLEHYRADHPDWEGEVDLSTPRTQEQRAVAEAATMTFPDWGEPRAELERITESAR